MTSDDLIREAALYEKTRRLPNRGDRLRVEIDDLMAKAEKYERSLRVIVKQSESQGKIVSSVVARHAKSSKNHLVPDLLDIVDQLNVDHPVKVAGSMSSFFTSTLTATVSGVSKLAKSPVGKTLSFVATSLGTMYLGSFLGSPIAGQVIGNLAVTIIKSVVKNSGKKQIGYDIVGVITQHGSRALGEAVVGGGFAGAIIGTVVGSIIDDKFTGRINGRCQSDISRLPQTQADLVLQNAVSKTSEYVVQKPLALATDKQKLKWYNKNKVQILTGVTATAIATAATSAVMTGDFHTLFRNAWDITLESGYFQMIVAQKATAAIRAKVGIPAGSIRDFVRHKVVQLLGAENVKQLEKEEPETAKRVKWRVYENTVSQINKAWVATLVADVVGRTAEAMVNLALDKTITTTVHTAAKWRSLDDAMTDVQSAYDTAHRTVDSIVLTAKRTGEMLDVTKMYEKVSGVVMSKQDMDYPTDELKNDIDQVNSGAAVQATKDVEIVGSANPKADALKKRDEFKLTKKLHKQRLVAEKHAKEFADTKRAEFKRAKTEFKRVKRQRKIRRRVQARRKKDDVKIDIQRTQERIDISAATMTLEMVKAMEDFRESTIGKAAEAIGELHGDRVASLGYQTVKMLYVPENKVLKLMKGMATAAQAADIAKTTTRFAKLASRGTSAEDMTVMADRVASYIPGSMKQVADLLGGNNAITEKIQEYESEYASFDLYQNLFDASGFNPFQSKYDRVKSVGNIIFGDAATNSVGSFGEYLTSWFIANDK